MAIKTTIEKLESPSLLIFLNSKDHVVALLQTPARNLLKD